MGCRPRNRVTDPRNFQFLRKEKYIDQSHRSHPKPTAREPISRAEAPARLSAVYDSLQSKNQNQERSSRTAYLSGPFLPGVPTRRTLNQSREFEFSQLVEYGVKKMLPSILDKK